MSELETKHYIANGAKEAPAAREAIEWAGQTQAQLVDLKFCDLLGRWQHMTLPLSAFDRVRVRRGPRLRAAPRSAAGRGSPSRTCC